MVQWNIRSFRSNFEEMKLLLNRSQSVVVALQECRLGEGQSPPRGYALLLLQVNKSNESAAGPDGVYYQLVRYFHESCLHILLKLFNNIWTTGDIFPSRTEASMIPIPKAGKNPSDPSNYRPIALTRSLCKTLERMSGEDYGSVVYGSAKKHVLRALDPIHRQSLRIALGAFRKSPIKSLYAEAGEPSLEHRRTKLALNYKIILKLKSLPRNPCHDIVFLKIRCLTFLLIQSQNLIFIINTFEHIKNANINLNTIDNQYVQCPPPCDEHQVHVDISLTKQKKEDTSEVDYQKEFFRIKENFSNHYAVVFIQTALNWRKSLRPQPIFRNAQTARRQIA
ncbi:LINE-1 retrotransposable element orf2 protein [Plakobranchus ocellatus]|uniref:LINE-1 retrotransposable element orf2 protein n=1 Tax=Plakobranchus ocellatus TaxID=259542 RepID=A0AAV4BID4_9GAST|nr:LINE-1 retrotransposable element orf2 protein [Plakobranchus ocellatus]